MAAALNRKPEKAGKEELAAEEFPLTAQPRKNEINEKSLTSPKFRYKPVELTCPHCAARTRTTLTYHITNLNHIAVFVCSLVTWPCGLCFLAGIPYCLNCCQKVDHHCSDCHAIVGEHSKC